MALRDPGDRRAVIVVSSHVVRGSVGNRAAVFALETLGHPVWAVPTVVLPWHPGHGRATRIVPEPDAFAAMMRDLANAPWLGEVGAVLSGYLGDAAQAAAIAGLVRAVRSRNPACTYLCDPVIGDRGGLYVPQTTAEAMRDELLPIADIVTPNRFELGWLSGTSCETVSSIIDAAARIPPPRLLVTSSPAGHQRSIGNLWIGDRGVFLAEHRLIENAPNGLGDLTAALLLARLMDGQEEARAVQDTTASVYEVLARTARRGADELMLETDAGSLSSPSSLVKLTVLSGPGDRTA